MALPFLTVASSRQGDTLQDILQEHVRQLEWDKQRPILNGTQRRGTIQGESARRHRQEFSSTHSDPGYAFFTSTAPLHTDEQEPRQRHRKRTQRWIPQLRPKTPRESANAPPSGISSESVSDMRDAENEISFMAALRLDEFHAIPRWNLSVHPRCRGGMEKEVRTPL